MTGSPTEATAPTCLLTTSSTAVLLAATTRLRISCAASPSLINTKILMISHLTEIASSLRVETNMILTGDRKNARYAKQTNLNVKLRSLARGSFLSSISRRILIMA